MFVIRSQMLAISRGVPMYTSIVYFCTRGVKMQLGKKLKAIRLAENLNQLEMSQLIDISIDSIKSYETLRRTINEGNLMKITNNERFSKYTLWLMIGKTAPESNQVSPDFSILLACGLIEEEAEKRA